MQIYQEYGWKGFPYTHSNLPVVALVSLLALTDPLDRGWLLGHKWKISSPLVSTPTLSVYCTPYSTYVDLVLVIRSAIYRLLSFPIDWCEQNACVSSAVGLYKRSVLHNEELRPPILVVR